MLRRGKWIIKIKKKNRYMKLVNQELIKNKIIN